MNILVRREIETYLCCYSILSEQGAIQLEKCVSLYSGQELREVRSLSVEDMFHLQKNLHI